VTLTLSSFLWQPVPAEATIGQTVVGKTIKTVVRGVIFTTNLVKAKKKLIGKLENMSDEKFRAKYTKLYKLVKDLPADIKDTYNITSEMTKEQMIKNIGSVDKKEVYRIIRFTPDKTVSDLFHEYLREMRSK